jgi:KaiC/GvpD/RAD55 family RecA-like ATPase
VPPRRLSTGLPALDKAFRGGVPVGIVWTIVGAPGSCKTTLAYQATMTMRDQGALVCVLAYDEPPASMLVRLGRHIGLDRDRIESGAPECMDAIEAHSRTHDWLLVDGMGEVPVSIDAAADELLRRSNGRPMVLMVDSIQRAWVDGIEDVDSPRQQVDMIVRALRRAAARGILIIATCEAARGLYRGGAREGKINAIAAGKESGSIEYRSDALLVLDAKEPDDTEEGHVVLSGTWAKNRIRSSKATTLWFVLDRERSVLSECDAPIDEEAPTSGNDRRPRKPKDSTPGKEELMRAALAVEAYVRTEPGCGKNEIRDAVKGFSHDLKNSAVQWLERAGRIESRPPAKKGRGRPSECWFITPSGKEAAHGFAHETGGANRDEK